MSGFRHIVDVAAGTINRVIRQNAARISEDTAKRLIAEAEARGQHDHAEALRRVWREQGDRRDA